ncbi:amidase [Marinomonas sp. A79]|uniref:Amidase n=1 Tax=Marinomonas vulgaris TaxID=2823372 RepID=A0ABS5HEN1_9GAMM|nr:amidase [Marinomonas vulgaris]MBR7889982.1 amidase [Marinomonas vulgaris]
MKHFPVENPFLTPSADLEQPDTTAGLLPLSGLRLAVKDLFHMAGLPTSAGNPTWLATHPIPTQTASSVTALIEAGAEFCGKTITDELAYSLNGQNIHYGTLINPLTPNRLPGGSSSGSAIAVAKELADIGLGTDTGGSIRVPASYNGLFGLRPTHGIIAADNMVALAPSFDTVGLLTRDLATLTKAAKVLLSASASALPAHSINKVLIADNLINQVAHMAELKTQLANWRDKDLLPNEATLHIDTQAWQTSATFRTLQGAEIWQEHGEWVTLVTEHDKKAVFAPDIQTRFAWCDTLSGQEIQAAQQQRADFTDWLESELKEGVLIIPTTPGLSPLLEAAEADLAVYRNQLMDITAIAGLAGLPQLHLPVCTLNGAPCGLSLVGPKGSDLALIDFATHLME